MKSAHDGQLMLSIGALLASEREKRGIPVEKAAKETRMRPQRIRDMEGDDLSHFTNPSYARMFIIAYAKYLGIPMKTISDHLPDRGESATEGYQYISTSTEELPSLRHDIATKPARGNNALVTLAIAILTLVLVVIGGLSYYFFVVTAPRLVESQNKPAATPEPIPPPPQVVIIHETPIPTFSNLLPDGSKASAFDGGVEMDATPAPVILSVANTTTPALNTASAPAQTPAVSPTPVVTDDHDFLLNSAPDATPASVR